MRGQAAPSALASTLPSTEGKPPLQNPKNLYVSTPQPATQAVYFFWAAPGPPAPPGLSPVRGLNLGGGSRILRFVELLTLTTREWMAHEQQYCSFM
eukprot:CAMPEP_0169454878 /NCGR_PEP_ID=MMETSP1042-20121227/15514_1 /TAXON_ID=464988 /ORGANISM="Hemiselmis andersenii, Strain CCMP1180" /LENGTH=95 /DNA_ID=CAMNT_0009566983 /DNA_START=171 /DNA_END=457 /DNA_ORIENTATION=-